MRSFWASHIREDIKDVLRALRRRYHVVADFVTAFPARRSQHTTLVRDEFPADDPQRSSNSVAVYVHFDNEGVVFDYVVFQLKQLVEAGFRITFVSNSPVLPKESRERLAPYCRTIIWRFNTGYDFGAYKDGIASLTDVARIDQLVLMNDSVYGPFWSLRDILATIDRSTTDYWGIVDNWEISEHLQTFFLLFLPSALQSPAFRRFWNDFPYINKKWWVVRNGETRLSSVLAKNGLRSQVLVPYRAVVKTVQERMTGQDWKTAPVHERQFFEWLDFVLRRGRPANPMHYFWDIVITDYRCPFIKRELIGSNPANIPAIESWRDVIRSVSNYDVSLIDDHQDALRARRT